MSEFIPGQRFISDGEADLGLGTILKTDFRTVMVLFNAHEETRTYNLREAPLTRVAFTAGDIIESAEGDTLRVQEVRDDAGLLTYCCARVATDEETSPELVELPESRLNDRMQFHQARERLLTGQVDRNDRFNLRYRSRQHIQRIEREPAYGFSGPRVDLVNHQLAIANDVSSRHYPRVLLADEVGLGKTIEAGLILHRLLLTERISRVLILVPTSLSHQWLIELKRRFDLPFTLLDEHQSEALANEANPFETSQLVLASQQWLFANPRRQQEAEAAGWDLVIVDEAHHLDARQEDGGYATVERLSRGDCGLLLLTATPEQMGIERHFERLRLLDPERYHSLEAFQAEEEGFAVLADLLDDLEKTLADDTHKTLPATLEQRLGDLIASDQDAQHQLAQACDAKGEERQQALARLRRLLIDRYGIGRVMFHNSRRDIKGFPERQLHVEALEPVQAYRRILGRLQRDEDYLDTLMVDYHLPYPELLLYPEQTYTAVANDSAEPWWRIDPRIEWIREWIKAHPGEKALVICHRNDTARELATAIQILNGHQVPVFDEDTSLLERDRAAADFADREGGSPILVCSEIGSEGRNFQFCHHLILFDLPPHPELLEQRIGRLDRIGQSQPIQIHALCLQGGGDHALLRWYHEGLAAFGAPNGLGGELYERFSESLDDALLDETALAALISESQEALAQRLAERSAGRYRLLAQGEDERDSLAVLHKSIEALDNDPRFARYIDQAFDVFGVDSQDIGNDVVHLTAGQHMMDGLPGLAKDEEGFSATTSRERALERDDVEHLGWEHPLVREMLERTTDGSLGNTALALLKHPAIPGGRLMAEMVFVTHTAIPKRYQVGRFMPPTTVRVLLDEQGTDLSDKVSFGGLANNLKNVKKSTARELIKQCVPQLRSLFNQAEQKATDALPALVDQGKEQLQAGLEPEIARLKALQQRNPAVHDDEIAALEEERDILSDAIANTRLRFDAVRVIVTVGMDE